ncbi:MAG: Anthranilate phosphoribosyltransferase [Labilithrix sp.]|nr:Anthranilate phosphoribosyltransferase [Labilithrix sp.]
MADPPAAHPSFAEVFARIETRSLGPAQVRAAFGAILSGAWTPVQIGAFAASLRMQGESAETIVAAAEALRAVMSTVEHDHVEVVDTCGTGGDGAHTLNVSTAAAIVVAGAGCHVAKHGNRSVSSRCGSADVVDALGIPTDLDPTRQHEVLREARIAFLMAPAHHPALRHAAQARSELGLRTIFNALGPLVNPAKPTHQLVGVYDDALRPVMATALGKLGVRRAWVVRSEDGLDEISPSAATRVSVLDDGVVTERVVTPDDFGVERIDLEALRGGDAPANAAAIVAMLAGEHHPAVAAVVLNAAAALSLVRSGDLRACAEEARAAIASRRAQQTFEGWRRAALDRRSRTEPAR